MLIALSFITALIFSSSLFFYFLAKEKQKNGEIIGKFERCESEINFLRSEKKEIEAKFEEKINFLRQKLQYFEKESELLNQSKENLEKDPDICEKAKQVEFNGADSNKMLIKTLANVIRSKVKNLLTSMINSNEDRYKIVAHIHTFQKTTAGLHIASRCLWNTATDNFLTITTQGVNCDVLIVIFLCYTDLGNI